MMLVRKKKTTRRRSPAAVEGYKSPGLLEARRNLDKTTLNVERGERVVGTSQMAGTGEGAGR